MKIVVGVDGSEGSERAIEWCARHAGALGAEVVAVHALEMPVFTAAYESHSPPVLSPGDRERIQTRLRGEWCKQLADAGVPYRAEVVEGYPPKVIIDVVAREDADLVVTGRRGLGGFTELLLGSTTHHLSHHLDRPLVIVP